MIKNLSLIIAIVVYVSNAAAQQPVKWKFSTVLSLTHPEIQFTADIEEGWHIYSQNTPDGGPLPMIFTFDSSACYKLVDQVKEPSAIEAFDPVFEINVKYLEGRPVLTQKVEVASTPCKISGRIDYQACKEICIPLDTVFSITLKE